MGLYHLESKQLNLYSFVLLSRGRVRVENKVLETDLVLFFLEFINLKSSTCKSS